MDKQYRDYYHQAMLDFKCATNEDEQWQARKSMAKLEVLAIEMFGENFQEELRRSEELGESANTPEKSSPRRYTQGNGVVQPKKMQEAARFVEEYSRKIEQQVENNRNFLIEDSSIFPFEIREGYHAALRYAYIAKSDRFENINAAESEIRMNITAAIYRDGTLNEYDQGIEERKFILKGVDAINQFCNKLEQSVKDGIKAHPDIQPVVTVNYSEYDKYNPLVGDHMRLSLDRANSLFELIDIVAGKEVREKGSGAYYKTSANIMFIQNGKIGHFDFGQEFGKSDGSIIKQIEGYMEEQIKYLDKHPEIPDKEERLKQWEAAKKELIPYFNKHISLSRAERDLEYLGKAATVMQGNIYEMRAFLNTGEIVPVPGKEQPEQEPQEEENARDSRVYLSLPHVSREKFPALLQELKQNGASFDVERKQWYVDRKATGSGLFNAYLWTYLTLPPMKKEEFDLARQQIKQDGARFDQNKKKWYIDGNCDREKFLQYLEPDPQGHFSVPVSGQEAAVQKRASGRRPSPEQAVSGVNRVKTSVLGKLEKAKETVPHGTDDQARDARQHRHENAI